MPAEVTTPVKRPRRLTLRRVLLAVVLGLAAWWSVGWWLSPRPLYTLQFDFPNVEQAINYLSSMKCQLGPKTQDGRYFCVNLLTPLDEDTDTIRVQVYDSQTGGHLKTHEFTKKNFTVSSPRFPDNVTSDFFRGEYMQFLTRDRIADASGCLKLLGHARPNQQEVWSWNLLTGDVDRIYSSHESAKTRPRLVGSGVAEWLHLPAFVIPFPPLGDWLGPILAVVGPASEWDDLGTTMLQLHPLIPDAEEVSITFAVPTGLGHACFVADNWLVSATAGPESMEYRRPVSPQRVDIYNLHRGQLHRSVPVEEGSIMGISSLGPDLLHVWVAIDMTPQPSGGGSPKTFQTRSRCLHLPSGRWLDVGKPCCAWTPSTAVANDRNAMVLLLATERREQQIVHRVWEIQPDGNIRLHAETSNEVVFPWPIPESNLVFGRESVFVWPQWVREACKQIVPGSKWPELERNQLVLWNYAEGRTVRYVPSSPLEDVTVLLDGKALLLHGREGAIHLIEVFALPLVGRNTKWTYAIALVVAAIPFVTRRRCPRL